jgi:adenylate cyclase
LVGHAPGAAELVEGLRALQDVLGDMHDAHVFAAELSPGAAPAGPASNGHAHGGDGEGLGPAFAVPPEVRSGLTLMARVLRRRRARLYTKLEHEWLGVGTAAFAEEVRGFVAHLRGHRGEGVEIERKFLLYGVPPEVRHAPSVEIEQGWLAGARIAERFRRVRGPSGERFYRTIKAGAGARRLEFEEETTRELFAAVWPLTAGRRVRKRRYRMAGGGLVWEIDDFLDRELVLAEVELPSAGAEATPPAWLAPHVVREVTGEPEFVNLNLAR